MPRKPLLRIPKEIKGILFMVASMLCLSVMNTLVGIVSFSAPTPQMVFIRNVLGVAIMLPWVLYALAAHGRRALHTPRWKSHLWRAGIGIMAMELWFYSLSVMPLTQATALSFTTPLFVTIFAVIFLKERVGVHRWSAVFIGFIGALIIIRPDPASFNNTAFFVLTSSSLMAISSVLVKTLTKTEPAPLIVLYMALFMTLFSFPLGVASWQPLSDEAWLGLFGIALISTLGHILMANAYMRTDITLLIPFDFTRLIFTGALAYITLGEVVDNLTVLGATIITTSAAYIAHREVRHKKQAPLFDADRISS